MVLKKNRIYLINNLYACELYGENNTLIVKMVIRDINHIAAGKTALELARLKKYVTADFNPMLSYTLIHPAKFGATLFKMRVTDTTYDCNKNG